MRNLASSHTFPVNQLTTGPPPAPETASSPAAPSHSSRSQAPSGVFCPPWISFPDLDSGITQNGVFSACSQCIAGRSQVTHAPTLFLFIGYQQVPSMPGTDGCPGKHVTRCPGASVTGLGNITSNPESRATGLDPCPFPVGAGWPGFTVPLSQWPCCPLWGA